MDAFSGRILGQIGRKLREICALKFYATFLKGEREESWLAKRRIFMGCEGISRLNDIQNGGLTRQELEDYSPYLNRALLGRDSSGDYSCSVPQIVKIAHRLDQWVTDSGARSYLQDMRANRSNPYARANGISGEVGNSAIMGFFFGTILIFAGVAMWTGNKSLGWRIFGAGMGVFGMVCIGEGVYGYAKNNSFLLGDSVLEHYRRKAPDLQLPRA